MMRFNEEAIMTALLPAEQQRPFVRAIYRTERTESGRRFPTKYQAICNAHDWTGDVRSRRSSASDQAHEHENSLPHGRGVLEAEDN